MIPAAKGGPFGWALDRYIGWKFRSAFRGLWVRGELPPAGPGRLVYLNHANWWDGFMLHQLSRVAGWDAYCLMDEENLRRYRFLARIGAFSIRRKDAMSSIESLRYAFFEHELPDVLLEVGTPHPPGPLSVFQTGLETVVKRLMTTTSLEGFTRKVSGARGVAERWDAARGVQA